MKKFLLFLTLILSPVIAYATVGAFVPAKTQTITAGGTWQVLFPAPTVGTRQTIWIENPCTASSQGIGAAESLFVYFGTPPVSGTAGAFELAACGSLVMTGPYINQQQISVEASSTSHAFTADQTQ